MLASAMSLSPSMSTKLDSGGEATPLQKELNLALMEAAGKLAVEEVQTLLCSGASAKFTHCSEGVWDTRSTKTALHCAISAECSTEDPETPVAVIRALVNAKADVNAKMESRCWARRKSCRTAWDMVLHEALQRPALLWLFLENGADVNAKHSFGFGGMGNDGYKVQWLLNRVIRAGNAEVVKILLERRANANAADSLVSANERGLHSDSFETALHLAAAAGQSSITRLLLEHGADVNALQTELLQEDLCRPLLQSSLHLAIKGGHGELVKSLVCWGADTSRPLVKKSEWGGPYQRFDRRPGDKDPDADFDEDDERTSCEALCRSDAALLKALQVQYSSETHHLFPSKAQILVKTFLLIAKRQRWRLPQQMLFQILFLAVPALSAPLQSSGEA